MGFSRPILVETVALWKGGCAIDGICRPKPALYVAGPFPTTSVCLPGVPFFNLPAIEGRGAQAAADLGIAGGINGFYDFVVESDASCGSLGL